MNNKQTSKFLFIFAGTLTLTGAFIKFFDITYAPYIFSAGAVLLIFLQAKSALDNKNAGKRQRRLGASGFLASLALGLAAYFMFAGSNTWVVLLLIYALSTFFLSFRGESTK